MYYYNPYYDSMDEQYPYERKGPTIRESMYFPADEAFVKGNVVRNQYDPYRSYRPVMPEGKTEREKLLLSLMIYGEVCHDLVLCLDNEPNDKMAMDLFTKYRQKYSELERDYVQKYGPLCVAQAMDDQGTFSWLKVPSPWLGR